MTKTYSVPDLLNMLEMLDHATGKHTKHTLSRLESLNLPPEIFREVRKAVLDGYNDLRREIERRVGLTIEE